MVKQIYIVRHGETALNNKGIIQCQVDTNTINQNGVHQANQVGKLLPSDIDVIFSSPLKRAVATSAIISQYNNAETFIVDGLEEMFGGNIHQMTVEEFEKTEFNPPIIYKNAITNEDIVVRTGKEIRDNMFTNDVAFGNFAYPHGESKIQAKARFERAVKFAIKNHPDAEKILVVSHGFTIKSFIMGIDELKDFRMMRHSDILQFSFENDKFKFVNYIRSEKEK